VDNLSPELQFDRELSLLAFHSRVLEQAKDESTPLLERLRFVCISTTNLDEFFEVRVAGLMQQRALGLSEGHSGLLQASHILEEISHRAHQLVDEQYRVLNEILIPELAANKIRFVFQALFQRPFAAGDQPTRSRPGSSLSPYSKQKPELHRVVGWKRCLRS